MTFEIDQAAIMAAEAAAAREGASAALAELRNIPQIDYGMLIISLPRDDLPNLSRVLPRMAQPAVQLAWTGSHGYELYRATADFLLRTELNFYRICKRPLKDCKILDFGCGYGRITRALYWHTDPSNIWALDPRQESIDICKNDGLLGNLRVSDYVPESLPVEDNKFDLIFSYSVFTHTSERVTRTALSTLRKYIKDDGLLVITVRPVESLDLDWAKAKFRPDARSQFEASGFVFVPEPWPDVDGELVFGDTIIHPDWLKKQIPEWEFESLDRGQDHHQVMIQLRPK